MTRRRRSRSVGRTASLVASVVLFGTAGCSGTGRGYGGAASTGSSTSVATSTTALASVTTASVTTPAVVPTTLLPPARVGGLVSLPPIGSSPSVQVTLVQLVDPGVGTISNPVAGDRYVGVQLRVKNTGTAPAQQ